MRCEGSGVPQRSGVLKYVYPIAALRKLPFKFTHSTDRRGNISEILNDQREVASGIWGGRVAHRVTRFGVRSRIADIRIASDRLQQKPTFLRPIRNGVNWSDPAGSGTALAGTLPSLRTGRLHVGY